MTDVHWASWRTGVGHPGKQNGTLHGPADWVQYVHCTAFIGTPSISFWTLGNAFTTSQVHSDFPVIDDDDDDVCCRAGCRIRRTRSGSSVRNWSSSRLLKIAEKPRAKHLHQKMRSVKKIN